MRPGGQVRPPGYSSGVTCEWCYVDVTGPRHPEIPRVSRGVAYDWCYVNHRYINPSTFLTGSSVRLRFHAGKTDRHQRFLELCCALDHWYYASHMLVAVTFLS